MATDSAIWTDEGTLAYLLTRQARSLLEHARDKDQAVTRRLSEAAYHLSDPMCPNERAEVEAALARHQGTNTLHEHPEQDALLLASEALATIDRLLHGPTASAELLMARKALRRGIDGLASDDDSRLAGSSSSETAGQNTAGDTRPSGLTGTHFRRFTPS